MRANTKLKYNFYMYDCECKPILDSCNNQTKNFSCECYSKENPINYGFGTGVTSGFVLSFLVFIILIKLFWQYRSKK